MAKLNNVLKAMRASSRILALLSDEGLLPSKKEVSAIRTSLDLAESLIDETASSTKSSLPRKRKVSKSKK